MTLVIIIIFCLLIILLVIWIFSRQREKYRDDSEGFLLVHIPKTGGSAIKSMGIETVDKSGPWHKMAKDVDSKHQKRLIAFVRNPYDRLVSVFSYYKQAGMGNEWYLKELANVFEGFDDFVMRGLDVLKDYHHLRPQYTWTHDEHGRRIVPKIVKYEEFEKNVHKFFGKTPPKKNASGHRDWREYYKGKPWISNKVYEIYQRDFEEFNYSSLI